MVGFGVARGVPGKRCFDRSVASVEGCGYIVVWPGDTPLLSFHRNPSTISLLLKCAGCPCDGISTSAVYPHVQLRTDGPSDSCFPKARPVSDFQPMLMRWSQLLQPGYAASANGMCNQRRFRFTFGQKMALAARVTAKKCVLGGWGGRQALAAPLTAGKRGFGDIGGGGTREGGKTWLKIKKGPAAPLEHIFQQDNKRGTCGTPAGRFFCL